MNNDPTDISIDTKHRQIISNGMGILPTNLHINRKGIRHMYTTTIAFRSFLMFLKSFPAITVPTTPDIIINTLSKLPIDADIPE